MRRLAALFLAFMMLLVYIAPVSAIDMESIYTGVADIQVQPGNPRAEKPEYRYSWLDNVVIRYDPSAVTSAAVTPRPSDYPYSETFEQFVEEVDNYSMLFELNEYTVSETYEELTSALFYTFTAMGFTDTQDSMREYLVEKGVKLPLNETAGDKAKIAVVYAALKYNAVYVLYEKEVVLPRGISLDEATVVIISALLGTSLPSGIDTFTGLAVLMTKNYVEQFEQLPVSDNPDASEIFHWAKVITAAKNEYQVPLEAYDDTTKAQREYVDYAYYASIINTLYDINVDPIYLVLALQSTEKNSLQKFILKSMLDEKKVSYSEKASCEELFDLACKHGYFDLEQDFYADIFIYELKVPASCEKVWFTPFTLAGQLQGSDAQYVTIYLNGTKMSANSTASTPLDPSKAKEEVELRVVYDDGISEISETVYTYNVIKDKSLDSDTPGIEQGDLVGEVQQFVDTIVPNENSVANEKVNGVFSAIGDAVSQVAPDFDELTTYATTEYSVGELLQGYDITTAKAQHSSEQAVTKRFDSDYLEDLIAGVYVTDANGNIVTTNALTSSQEEKSSEGVIYKVTEAVKESPEVVAVPTSLLAAFGVAGYVMNRKHRDSKEDEE